MLGLLDAPTTQLLSNALSGKYSADLPGCCFPIHFRARELPDSLACIAFVQDGELYLVFDTDAPLTFRHVRAMLREKSADLGIVFDPFSIAEGPEAIAEPTEDNEPVRFTRRMQGPDGLTAHR